MKKRFIDVMKEWLLANFEGKEFSSYDVLPIHKAHPAFNNKSISVTLLALAEQGFIVDTREFVYTFKPGTPSRIYTLDADKIRQSLNERERTSRIRKTVVERNDAAQQIADERTRMLAESCMRLHNVLDSITRRHTEARA